MKKGRFSRLRVIEREHRLRKKYRSKNRVLTVLLIKAGTYEDVAWVGDGSDDSGSNHELFPCLCEVDDVNSFIVTLVHVGVHQV